MPNEVKVTRAVLFSKYTPLYLTFFLPNITGGPSLFYKPHVKYSWSQRREVIRKVQDVGKSQPRPKRKQYVFTSVLIRVCEKRSAGFNTLHLLVREKTKNKQPYSADCYLLKLGISQSCVLLMGGDTQNGVFLCFEQ